MSGICVIGSLNMDLVVRTPRLPAPGETILGGPFATFAGGKGANQAVAAARLGSAVAMIGRVGDDEHGRALCSGLAADGVDVTAVRALPWMATGVALITVEQGGENTIVVAGGANGWLLAADFDRDAEARRLMQADWLVASLETPLGTVGDALVRAREAGTKTLLNAAPAAPLPAWLLALVDVLVVNRIEAAVVAGLPVDSAPEELARALVVLGCPTVVVTLGGDGALALDGAAGGAGAVCRQAAFAVKVVDAVAAGDAFTGALAVALAEGQALPAALRFACAAGALAATVAGAQPSLPLRAAVDAFLAAAGR